MVVQEIHISKNIDNYLDDLFLVEMSYFECSNIMFKFKPICYRLGVPIADEKTEGPVTSMEYFGLTIDNISYIIPHPSNHQWKPAY
jgi:hypothetical protein